MPIMKEAASAFLANKRIAVTWVSRRPKQHCSNNVYKRLRERGYDVFAVNPNADQVEGARSYEDLTSIPGGVDAVVIGTRPAIADDTMRKVFPADDYSAIAIAGAAGMAVELVRLFRWRNYSDYGTGWSVGFVADELDVEHRRECQVDAIL